MTLSASHVDILHSAGGGALPELPEWAVTNKRSVTMELEGDNRDSEVEEEERRYCGVIGDIFVKSHSRSRRGIWLTKRREQESPRKVILDNLSKRKDVELFV